MPNFVLVKQWIKAEAKNLGGYISERQAKALAGSYMTNFEDDPALRSSSLTYRDSTGEEACRAWFRNKIARK